MRSEELSALVMDNQDFLCYMSDIETYELIYVNKSIKEAFGFQSENDYLGKPCHLLLQNKENPCEFCNNHLLQEGEKISWDIQNKVTGKHYSLIDTLVNVDGRKARLEVAFDISQHYKTVESLTHKLTMEETLIRCIQTLVESLDIDDAINSLLGIVGEYYHSDRAYIFEFDLKNQVANNTYEWCSNPDMAEIDTLQNVPIEDLSPWLEGFEKAGEIFIEDLEKDCDRESALYHILKRQSIHSLMVVPLRANDTIVGFIGVDNPHELDKGLVFLHSVSLFVLDDIKKRRMRQQLEYLSYTDTLTGLFNRNKYMQKIEELEHNSLNSIGVLYVDINGLKRMNDVYGHSYGDSILQNVSRILCAHFENDVYRVGGDEFIVLCPNIEKQTFEHVVSAIRADSLDDSNCTFSVGSIWRDGKIDVLKEIAKSDEIMYAEKQSYYKTIRSGQVIRRSNSVEELLHEIRAGRFFAYFQPKVDMRTGEIVGAEALVRKTDKNNNLIAPDKFIPQYEYDGIIRHIDYFILETSCRLLKNLISEGKPLKISVNFSRVTFMEHDMVEEISRICDEYEIPHKCISVEITETIDKIDTQFFDHKLNALKDAGFGISMDDFGAKYSNLLMLSTAPFSEIKIDKSLIDGICHSPQSRTVVEYIIRMVHELGLSNCLAEGVETTSQKDILLSAGCNYGQGYLFYKPLPVHKFLEVY